MDSWLKQEALKNPDIKRLAHEEHTSVVINLPICLGAPPGSKQTFVGLEHGGGGGGGGGAAVPAEPTPRAGERLSPGWRGASPSVHRESRPSTLTPCYLGRSDCKRFLKILGSHHLETKQENCKNKPVDFYFKKANKHKLQEFPTVGHEIRFCFFVSFSALYSQTLAGSKATM